MTAGEIVIAGRFRGPPTSANGGYAAGALARHVDARDVEVRLLAPPPLDVALQVVEGAGGSAELRDGERVVAVARPAALSLDVPPPVTIEQAARAGAGSPMTAEEHPFPTCFGCGPLREPGDALRHMCGPVEGRSDVVACAANTSPGLPSEDGALTTEVVWAALDCPSASGALGLVQGPAHVLGTFTVRIERPVLVGEPHACIAWGLGADGRKKYGASAILDADGRVCARGRAVWVQLRAAG